MEDMSGYELNFSGPAALRRRALQDKLAADGGWLGLFFKLRDARPNEGPLIDDYMALAIGAVSPAEQVANHEANQRHRVTTGEAAADVSDRNFMQLAAADVQPEDISNLQFCIGMHLVAHPGQPISLPGQE